MKNSIVAGQTIGIVMHRSYATMDATLWGSGEWLVGTKTKNTDTGTNVTTNDYDGDPLFVDATNRNYHLGAGSTAIDKGVATAVTIDIDQEARSNGQPDLGADEAWPCTIIESVTVNGPAAGSAGSILAFQASTSPQNATTPIRYHWTPEPFSGQGKASVAYKFSADGSQSISVLAQNCAPGANGNKVVEISTYYVQIPVVMKSP
jgi:hypothetical protein